MKRILFIYPNADGYQRIPLGAAIVINDLKAKGCIVELFDTTFMKAKNTDNELREEAGFVKKTDKIGRENLSERDIEELLINRMEAFKPEFVFASIVEDNYRYATSLFKVVKGWDEKIKIIVGGTTPTVAPMVIRDNPYIDHVIIGEGENRIWFDEDMGIMLKLKGEFTDLDTIPDQDFSLWDDRHFVKPYDGKLYRAGFIEMSRGCMNHCSYCVNAIYQEIFKHYGKYYRKKSVDRLIEEAITLKEENNLNMFFFTDDDFLFMNLNRFDTFVNEWVYKINLPYWINTRTEWITEHKLRGLQINCAGIGFGIECGNEKFRNTILNRKGNNKSIIEKFKMMKDYGIRTTANFMLGFPFETEEIINDTIELARKIKADSIDVTYVTPYYGTALYGICADFNLIELDTEPGFVGMAKNISMRKEPTIRNKKIKKEKVIEYYNNFQRLVNE